MDILENPTEWLIPSQALELAQKGLEEASERTQRGDHMEAALAFMDVSVGLGWQAMHQRALALGKEKVSAKARYKIFYSSESTLECWRYGLYTLADALGAWRKLEKDGWNVNLALDTETKARYQKEDLIRLVEKEEE